MWETEKFENTLKTVSKLTKIGGNVIKWRLLLTHRS